MPFDFKLPDLGEGITEGEIRKWLVKEGDSIEEHQTVLEIETDKAVVEVPSPKKGKILKINKEEGDIAKVGEILMTIVEEGEEIEEKPKAKVEEAVVEERPKSVSVVGVLPEEEEGILATPAVRALARELGVNLETIKGSGNHQKPKGILLDIGDTLLYQESLDPALGLDRLLQLATNSGVIDAAGFQDAGKSLFHDVVSWRVEIRECGLNHIELRFQSFLPVALETFWTGDGAGPFGTGAGIL